MLESVDELRGWKRHLVFFFFFFLCSSCSSFRCLVETKLRRGVDLVDVHFEKLKFHHIDTRGAGDSKEASYAPCVTVMEELYPICDF